MPLRIPTTSQIFSRIISNFQVALGQTIPAAEKAFIRVLSVIMSLDFTELYKFASERSFQNFALTATGTNLEIIGVENDVIKKQATAFKFTLEFIATGAWGFTAGSLLVGEENGIRYATDAAGSGGAGTHTVNVTSLTLGSEANLEVGAVLIWEGSRININPEAVVDVVIEDGLDTESEAAYRARVLAEIRTVGGGGNAVDYRRWSEEVTGVANAFPYAGKPLRWSHTGPEINFRASDDTISSTPLSTVLWVTNLGFAPGHYAEVSGASDPANNGIFFVIAATDNRITVDTELTEASIGPFVTVTNLSLAGDRSVFIEGVQPTYPDGVPDQALLDDVRDSINTDPVTGAAIPPLGETDETLAVPPIIRTGFVVVVLEMTAGDGGVADIQKARDEVTDAMGEYFANSVATFVDAIDSEIDRRNTITLVSIAKVVQDVLNNLGGSSDEVRFGLTTAYDLSTYVLNQGELAKLIAVNWSVPI